MVELFFRARWELDSETVLTPIHIDDSVSSLTAILLEDSYYELLLMERDIIDGITVLKPTGFIFILDIYRLPIYLNFAKKLH